MLTIPETIKTLFKTDGVRKNFRASFPNGELPDITNADVVKESLDFTESLCSQDPFKFGLSEASVVEFETVGIGNMYGMTIVCGIEIDTSSLTAAQISAIQSDPGDGALVLAAASDIGYGYYRVPLGTFKVTSCPRNHGAMAHRKVTAYSDYTGGQVQNNPFELAKLAIGWPHGVGDYTPNLLRIITAALAYRDPSLVAGLPVASTTAITAPSGTPSWRTPLTVGGVNIRHRGRATNPVSGQDDDHICVVNLPDYNLAQVGEWVRAQFIAQGLGDYADEAASAVTERYLPTNMRIMSYGPLYRIPPVDGKIVIYPYHASLSNAPSAYSWCEVAIDFPGGTATAQFNIFDLSNATFDVLTDSLPDIRGVFPPTGQGELSYSTFVNAYDFNELLDGWLELNGQFGAYVRTGGFEQRTLDNSSPIPVFPGDFEECWWDEYDVSPLDIVHVAFTTDGIGQVADLSLGDGSSRYDLTDNSLLKTASDSTLSSITALINSYFAPEVQAAAFTPVEMTMQGWPWIEAGDALEITAEDGTVVNTYALRVEMSGIQRLTMDVESKAGEIIGEV